MIILVEFGFGDDTYTSSIETNMIESIKSIVDNLVEEKENDEQLLKREARKRNAMNLKVRIQHLLLLQYRIPKMKKSNYLQIS